MVDARGALGPEIESYAIESEKLFRTLSLIYAKLTILNINSYEKVKTLDEIREAFAKIKKKKLKESSIALSELMAKTRTQRNCYSIIYSTFLMHLPWVKAAFEKAWEERKEYKIYINIRRYRDEIERSPFKWFHRMQRQPDKRGVCKDSGYASDILAREWGDEKLANRLRTEPTGWGVEGKKKILKIFDEKLKEIEKLNAPVVKYYETGQQLFKDIEKNQETFEKLKTLLSRELYLYNSMTKDNALLVLDELYDLFGEEAKLEAQGVDLVAKRKFALKDVLAHSSLLQREWARSPTRVFWKKHGETAFLILDTIAVLSLVFGVPLIVGAAAVGARRAGIFVRLGRGILRVIRPASKYLRTAVRAITRSTELVNHVRDTEEVIVGWKEIIKEIRALGKPVPEAVPMAA